jgi:hypothetical protein
MQSHVYITALLLLSLADRSALGQGALLGPVTFQNLDFESANLPDLPARTFGHGPIPASDAIPGWSAGGFISHNDLSLGGAAVIIYGPSWSDSRYILDGRYSLALEGPAIWQSGQVPVDSKSLLFDAFTFTGATPAMKVTFAGNDLPFIPLRDQGNYIVYGADITGFAGQAGELRFSSTELSATILDDIRFSTVAVPEPGTVTLFFSGLAILGFIRRRRSGQR